MGMIAALDVGGTSIKSGVVDADHESRGADAVALGSTIPTRAKPIRRSGRLICWASSGRSSRACDAVRAGRRRAVGPRLRRPPRDRHGSLRSVIDEHRTASVVNDHGRRLGNFLAPVVDELTIDLVVGGGGPVAAFDRFGVALRDALGPTPCVPAELGAAGPLLGAVRLAFPPN